VTANHGSGGAGETRNWGFPVLLGAIAFFGVLSMLPAILPALHLQLYVTAPTTSYGVTLMVAPREPHSVHVPAVAKPVNPDLPPAAPPTASQARENAVAGAEDKRLHAVLFAAARASAPEIIPVPGSLPTLVLTGGQGSYTATTLVQYGALIMLPHHTARLLDNVYVATNATLDLGGSGLRTLYLDSGRGGFATIVSQGGNLTFTGTARHPMTITSWDWAANSPGADVGYGRSYIRDAGGDMTFANVRVSALGFGSGQTGGVAWTGFSGKPGIGGATSSTFTDNTYGAFVSQGSGVTFRRDLFEFNAIDGVNIHQYSVRSSVISSSAVRNGDNGFAVDPATHDTVLENDISQHNSGNGYFVDGIPPVISAPASGMSIPPTASMLLGSGTRIEYSAATGNGKMSILVEGGTGTVIKGDQVCSGGTAVAVRDDSADAVVTGNTVRCTPRSAFSAGPSAPGIVLSGNAVDGARMGFLIRDAGPVQLYRNLVTRATVFGISVRGATSSVSGAYNTIAGTGFQAVDTRAGAPAPALYASNLSGWPRPERKSTFWDYLLFHPLAAMWLGILALVLLAGILARTRRMPSLPYPASTRWRGAAGPARASAVTVRGEDWGRSLEERFPDRVIPRQGPVAAARHPGPAVTGFDATFGGYGETAPPGTMGETAPRAQRAPRAHGAPRAYGAARPPWATAPMPKLSPRASDHDGMTSSWSREVDPE
jgi:hypothetical protein